MASMPIQGANEEERGGGDLRASEGSAGARPAGRRAPRGRKLSPSPARPLPPEPGRPPFRGPGGFWERASLQELAPPEGFERDPRRVWTWYDERRVHVSRCAPNAGHLALAGVGRARPALP